MRDLITFYLGKEGFDKLVFYLDFFEDDTVQENIKKYGTIEFNSSNEPVIKFRMYPSNVREVIYKFLSILPEVSEENTCFEEYLNEISEKERLYNEQREKKEKELRDGIRKLLQEDPSITGSKIAEELNVDRSAVYDRWHEIKKELGLE